MPADQALMDELQNNFAVFEKALPSLLKEHRKQYALMRHGEIVEFFDTAADAVRAGRRLYPDDLFSIQGVTDRPIDLGYHSHAVNSL